jgi:DNA-binding NtrC family response regulator
MVTMTVELEKLAQAAVERGTPYRILIVDDERWVRDVFKDFCDLTQAFEIELAGSGTEAIEKIDKGKYDLVTMDLIMPEMSGVDALAEIKKRAPRTPVMVITGNATDRMVKEAGVQGACRVMYKPILLEEFVAEVSRSLGVK